MQLRWRCLAVLVATHCGSAGAEPTPVIDNARVTVWDVMLAPGASGPPTPPGQDSVIMFLEGGLIRTVDSTGKAATVQRDYGDAVFVPRGASAVDTLVSGGPAHEIVVANRRTDANAFPCQGRRRGLSL
jgi:redox-sensitive bicupin YhaK (pirin superfamily)